MNQGAAAVTVVGSFNADLCAYGKTLPAPGQTLLADRFRQTPGGKGSNQALAAAKFGASVSFVACVGDDSYGKQAIELHSQHGVSTSFIRTDSAVHTGVAVILIDSAGRNLISVVSGANERLDLHDIDAAADAIRASRIVGFQLENPIPTILHGLRLAHSAGVRTLLDPAPAATLPDDIYRCIDVLKPNEHEAAMLTGRPVSDPATAERAADVLLARGVGAVIITLGHQGVWISSHQYKQFIAAPTVRAVDSTGAGDIFTGCLMAMLVSDSDLRRAARVAVYAASLSTTQPGIIDSIPSWARVQELLGDASQTKSSDRKGSDQP